LADIQREMAFAKRYSIYGACYLLAGVAVLFTHYLQTSTYNKAALDEKLTLIAASHFSLSQLVDNLPGLFKEDPHAAALKISDLKGGFLGAMYDARRMSSTEYKVFLETRIFDPKHPALPGYEMHVWESKRRKLRMIALSLKRMQFSEYLSGMGRNYALHYIIPLYILVGCLGLAAFHFFFADKKFDFTRLKITGAANRRPEPQTIQQVKLPAKTTANAWQLKSGVIAEGTIHATLAALSSLAGAAAVSLYARSAHSAAWQAVAEVRGALTVRGEAMDIPQPLVAARAAEAEILISHDRGEWLFYNAEGKAAQLCFGLKFASADTAPSADLAKQITAFVKAHSRSLLVEHYYENSILDAESGLYSSPYAMFTLKEKILGGLPFATAVFRFSEADFAAASLVKIARTAIRIMRENFLAEEAPVIARGQGNTVMIIFNAQKGSADRYQKAVQQLYTAYGNLGRRANAAFIQDTASCGSGARVVKIFERLLATSAAQNQLALYTVQTHLNII
jgi:hypothetical protein